MFRFFIFGVGFEVRFQDVPVEDVNAHGSQVAFRFGRFFLELGDAHVFVGYHDAEAAGFIPGDADRADSGLGVMFLVEIEHLVVVHGIDVVAGQDEDVIVADHFHEVQVLIDGIGRAAIPVGAAVALIWRQDIGPALGRVEVPRTAVADIPVQFQRLVLGQDTDRIDAGIAAVTQGEVDDAVFSAEQEARFSLIFGQDAQTAPFPAGQNHGQAIRFFHRSSSLLDWDPAASLMVSVCMIMDIVSSDGGSWIQ